MLEDTLHLLHVLMLQTYRLLNSKAACLCTALGCATVKQQNQRLSRELQHKCLALEGWSSRQGPLWTSLPLSLAPAGPWTCPGFSESLKRLLSSHHRGINCGVGLRVFEGWRDSERTCSAGRPPGQRKCSITVLLLMCWKTVLGPGGMRSDIFV